MIKTLLHTFDCTHQAHQAHTKHMKAAAVCLCMMLTKVPQLCRLRDETGAGRQDLLLAAWIDDTLQLA
jgi:hypothetical protein